MVGGYQNLTFFSHLAVLHFMRWAIVADPHFWVFVQRHADLMAAIRQDHAGFAVVDDAAANFGRHLIVLPDVCAVVVHCDSPVRRRPHRLARFA